MEGSGVQLLCRHDCLQWGDPAAVVKLDWMTHPMLTGVSKLQTRRGQYPATAVHYSSRFLEFGVFIARGSLHRSSTPFFTSQTIPQATNPALSLGQLLPRPLTGPPARRVCGSDH